MSFIKLFYNIFFGNNAKNILVHISAYVLTYLLVIYHLDWNYFLVMNSVAPRSILFSADILGFLIPPVLLIVLVATAKLKNNTKRLSEAYTLTKTVLLSFLVSLFYKSFTGRISPPHHGNLLDNSNEWNFGFMEHSVLGGWPSSHATVMFALATGLYIIYPKNKWIGILAYLFAIYVGFGVSIGFHWLSELLSGIIIGILVGICVTTKNK